MLCAHRLSSDPGQVNLFPMDKSESVPAITRSLFKRENDRRAGYVIPASASLGTSVTSRLHMMQPTNQRPCNVADGLSLFFFLSFFLSFSHPRPSSPLLRSPIRRSYFGSLFARPIGCRCLHRRRLLPVTHTKRKEKKTSVRDLNV